VSTSTDQQPGISQITQVIREDAAAVGDELHAALRPMAGGTLLVTGGSGFLCSYLLDTVAYLNDRYWRPGCRMICVDNLQSGLPTRIAHLSNRPDFRFVRHDVAQPLELGEPVHWLVHGASIASPMLYRKYPLETIDANVNGVRHMLELARHGPAKGMVYLSTSEIYGDPVPEAVPTPEDYRGNVSCTGPRACYDESKRLGETLCGVYHRAFNVPVRTVRPFNVYGPGQRLDDQRIMPDLIGSALRGDDLVLYSDGRATRAFCYVSDAVRALLHILVGGSDGEAYNVGNDASETSIGRLAEVVRDAARPVSLNVVHRVSADADYLTDNPQRRCPDLRKLRGAFPWTPQVDLREGIERTLRSYRELAGNTQ